MNEKDMENKTSIEEVLKQNGRYVSTTVGVSMYPMLRNRTDTIVIEPYEGRLNKYDIPLYKKGDTYILHRIVKVLPDSYVICGDNCINKEYGITDDMILGVLTQFYRGDHLVDMNRSWYKIYSRVWAKSYPFRRLLKKCVGKIKRGKQSGKTKDEL